MRSEFLVILSAGLLAGCAAGPNFTPPPSPEVTGYVREPLNTTSGSANVPLGAAQHFVPAQDIPGDWWRLFHSIALDALIERALTNNPGLRSAQAALTAARETVRAQKGAYFPSVAGTFSAQRQKTPAELSPTPNSGALYFNLFTPQVNVSYAPDVFGLNRRTVESLGAQAEESRFALAATQIALAANVAVAALQEASLRAQVSATRELIAINTNLLQMLRNQMAKGYVSRVEVAAQEAQLAQVAATLPPLLKQLSQQHDLLAALLGDFPAPGPRESIDLLVLHLPEDLPLTLPSQLVIQRPDVRQAQENLRAANAQVGIAVANRFPNFTLTADAGSMALAAAEMFAGGTGFWTLGGNITQPLFQGGSLRHKEKAARAAYLQALESYRGTVLGAFQNVADSLNALSQDADALSAAVAAKEAASASLSLATRQFQSGYANYLAMLSAEQTYRQASISLLQAQSNRCVDTVALFQALGGGWWNRPELGRN